MHWLLILTIVTPQGSLPPVPVAVHVDQRTCAIAGAGMVMILMNANPGIEVSWRCADQGQAGA